MGNSRRPSALPDELKRHELGRIEQRRQAAQLPTTGAADAKNSLLGLALSGGGLRSSLFNLGILQAFSHRGLLRYVDYIASVSGGGFTAGHLAALGAAYQCSDQATPSGDANRPNEEGVIDPSNSDEGCDAARAPTDRGNSCRSWFDAANAPKNLGIDPITGKKDRYYLFADAGGYLKDVPGWFGQWLGGTLLTFLLFFSGCGLVATILAIYWRSVDIPWFRERTGAFGIPDLGDELPYAFLPGVPIAIAWLSTAVARFVDRRCVRRLQGDRVFIGLMSIAMVVSFMPLIRMGAPDLSRMMVQDLNSATFGWIGAVLLTALLWLAALQPAQKHQHAAAQAGRYALIAVATGLVLLVQWGIATAVDPWPHIPRWLIAPLVAWVAFSIVTWPIHAYVQCLPDYPDRFRQPMRWMTLAVLLAIAVSVAVFLGNGITHFDRSAEGTFELNHFATGLAVVAAALQLLTLLGMDKLFRSEAYYAPQWQRLIFGLVITGVIALPVFAMVHWMASESVSGFAQHRDPHLEPHDVKSWRQMTAWLKSSDVARAAYRTRVTNRLHRVTYEQAPPSAIPDHLTRPICLAGLEFCADLGFDELIMSVQTGEDKLENAHYRLKGEPEWTERERRITTFDGAMHRASAIYGRSPEYKQYICQLQRQWILRRKLLARFNPLLTSRTPEILPQQLEGLREQLLAELMHAVFLRAEEMSRKEKKDEVAQPQPLLWYQQLFGRYSVRDPAYVATSPNTAQRRLADAWIDQRAAEITEGKRLKRYWRGVVHHHPEMVKYEPFGREGSRTLRPLGQRVLQSHEINALNRLLMESLYPDMIRPRTEPSTYIVAEVDQSYRMGWLATWAVWFALAAVVVDFNRISPSFQFYRDALGRHFLRPAQLVYGIDPPRPLKLSEADVTGIGLPYNLFIGCLMLRRGGTEVPDFRSKDNTRYVHQLERPVFDRLSFLLSPGFCGATNIGFCETDAYRGSKLSHGQLTLAEAVTISGSAISPYMTENALLTWFMSMFNARLGMWLPNPSRTGDRDGLSAKCWAVLKEWGRGLSRRDPADWDIGFVADGGFRDYLGAEELLERRCRTIIITDAGINRGQDEFTSLGQLIQTMRVEHGIRFFNLDEDVPIDLDRFRRDEATNRAPQQILGMRVKYPEERAPTGHVFYLQMAMTGREDVDLQQIRHSFPAFPDEPTTNQFFHRAQVEAYRQLGYHIGSLLCRNLPDPAGSPLNYDQLSLRLRMAYFEECRAEQVVQCDDVSPATLFDAAQQDLTLPTSEDAFELYAEESRAWLVAYASDADFRLFTRRRVRRLFNGEARPEDGIGLAEATDEGGPYSPSVVRSRLKVVALACGEMASPWLDLPKQRRENQDYRDDLLRPSECREPRRRTAVLRVGGKTSLDAAIDWLVDEAKSEVMHEQTVDLDTRDGVGACLSIFARQLYRDVYDSARAAEATSLMLTCLVGDLTFDRESHGMVRRDDLAVARAAICHCLDLNSDLRPAIDELLDAYGWRNESVRQIRQHAH